MSFKDVDFNQLKQLVSDIIDVVDDFRKLNDK